MQPIYLRMTRNEAVALMLDVDPNGKRGLGICGERQGVIAIETCQCRPDFYLEDLIITENICSEAEFFAADSLSYK